MSDQYPSDPAPRQIFIEAKSSIGESINPYTLQSQVTSWGGEQWIVTLNYPPLTREQVDKLTSFLQGKRQNAFLYDLPMGNVDDPVYNRTVRPVANDNTLLQVSGSYISRAGTYLSIENNIYKFCEDFNPTNLATFEKQTVTVWPRVVDFTPTTVDAQDPIRGWFKLVDFSSIGWTHELADLATFQVKMRSHIPLV